MISPVTTAQGKVVVKTGAPNGPGLPEWPRANEGSEIQVMVWDVQPQVMVDQSGRFFFTYPNNTQEGDYPATDKL